MRKSNPPPPSVDEFDSVSRCLAPAIADSIVSMWTYQIRASILAQATRRDYLGKLVEKSKLLESLHESDYPHEIPKMLQDMLRKETISDFSN